MPGEIRFTVQSLNYLTRIIINNDDDNEDFIDFPSRISHDSMYNHAGLIRLNVTFFAAIANILL